MRNEEEKRVYEIAREVAKEQATPTKPANGFDDSELKAEIAALKSAVTSLQAEIKVIKEPVIKKK